MNEAASADERAMMGVAAEHLASDGQRPAAVDLEVGRDEMNLAEFPLAAIADRVPDGQKTLVFEDQIWDAGKGETITRKLTISASDKFGLPTPLDDEVILGLIQLTKQSRFADRKVSFSRYELIQILGWRHEGKSYARLETSLKRWLGVTLYYDKAWWDKDARSWADENLHILEQVTLYDQDRRLARLRRRSKQAELPLSSFTWNEVVFRSFKSGYLKAIDLGFYRNLRFAASKRMYRFLDKRFYHKPRWEFDLAAFACEHVGLGRNYDTGQLKRRLQPAIDELVALGFLEPLSAAERYVQLSRGKWQVVFAKRADPKPSSPRHAKAAARQTPQQRALIERGVSPAVAAKLVEGFPADQIDRQIQAFDARQRLASNEPLRNPAGYLVKAIRQDFAAAGVAPQRNRGQGNGQSSRPRGQTPPPKPPDAPRSETEIATVDAAGAGAHGSALENQLAALDQASFDRLEAMALAQAEPAVAEGYRRSKTTGGAAHRAYRQMLFAGPLTANPAPANPVGANRVNANALTANPSQRPTRAASARADKRAPATTPAQSRLRPNQR